MFDVETDDPRALRRSIRLGAVGMAGSLLLLGWQAAMAALTGVDALTVVFGAVGVVMFVAFGIRTTRARRRLDGA